MVANETPATQTWVMLSYRIPREPSTPRIAVWRRLKALGVAQMGDGLVALPYDASTKEALEWVANSIMESQGSATIWIATPTVRSFGVALADQMIHDRIDEYAELIERAEGLRETEASSRDLKSLRAELRKIERRDYFPPPQRGAARAAVVALESTVDV